MEARRSSRKATQTQRGNARGGERLSEGTVAAYWPPGVCPGRIARQTKPRQTVLTERRRGAELPERGRRPLIMTVMKIYLRSALLALIATLLALGGASLHAVESAPAAHAQVR